jgi:uncharacterized FAD-dependent dehydrogenase
MTTLFYYTLLSLSFCFAGVEFRFGCKVEDFVLEGASAAVLGANGAAVTPVGQLKAVKLVGGEILPTDIAVLAVGHSARLVYDRLVEKGVSVEPKPIAVSDGWMDGCHW